MASEEEEIERQRREEEAADEEARRKREKEAADEEARRKERELVEFISSVNDAFGDGPPVQIPYEAIRRWTKDFDAGDKIGEGGFGDVHKGMILFANEQSVESVQQSRLPSSRRPVAVKKINAASLSLADATANAGAEQERVQRDLLRMAHREINVLASFRHPNLIRLIGYSLPQGNDRLSEICLVYELAGGGDLLRLLTNPTNPTPLDWRHRLRIMIEIAKGLNFLHCHDRECPALHRDIKSANIVVTDNGTSKIIDCGLSKYVPERLSDGTRSVCSTLGARFGTPAYTCPAYLQALTMPYDQKCDIYSYGVTLCEITTGQPQDVMDDEDRDLRFSIDTVDGIAADPRAGEWPEGCVEELKKLIKSCLERRSMRVSSMTSVMRGLLDIKNRFDSVSEVESRLSEENRAMRNQLQQLQIEAELSSRVAENEDTKDCPACFGTYKMSEGVVCTGNAKHFMCNDCFGYRVKSTCDDLTLYMRHGCAVVCAYCIAAPLNVCAKYDDAIICRVCAATDQLAMMAFLDARGEVARKLEEAKCQATREQDRAKAEEERLELMVRMAADQAEKRRAEIQIHRNRIMSEIIETRCPSCKHVFGGWDGCFAVHHYGEVTDRRTGITHRNGCGRYFCGWCLKQCDSDGEAHRHAANCTMSKHPGSVYGRWEDFIEVQAEVRRAKIVTYLDSVNNPDLRAAILDAMRETDLAPLGIRL